MALHRLPLNEGEPAPLPSEDKPLSPKVAALVDQIVNLSLLDVADLNKALKKRLNIADQPMMPAGMMMSAAQAPNGASASSEKPAEEQSDMPQKMTFSVKLTKFDDTKKIAVIKEIRNLVPGLNLVQAKKFVETAPVVVKEDMGKAEAEEMKKALEKVGATVEIV
ncbi:Ribosomal protein L7/L12 domain protein [Ancylostoma caninum]|uniref:Ribosomal protein L7/L12 domain protein n=1 Tax=Ancylostoma caninum TaxID=29170 RepID=A0A368H4B8_ANCCA|nr:Ribosomal protein L7/L12 domain protein [Ancylostoma caninum]